ncbi:MFS transporter [Carnobacterium divergens]|uniref:MFS transporter n=2 Tax=Carnobacteriaceae TaxID=186828 RepID=A0A5F0MFD9_CARDV|nr:MFS transporter [Carnobacterium divergens]TFI62698.1 MFS transporter [Carnobacterium divergens]TFI72809.1 MFS transporter [Carnobacterium divergens]TFI73356.1 MFS transporter [Carnobacterium divergens]TFI77043.1 MFS transporter [Carnobacterium divergens]
MSGYQKRVLASSAAGLGLESMDIMFLSFALTSIIADLNVNGAAAGLISSITNVGMLLGGVIFGVLADKYGRIKIFTYTILIFALATGAMYFASNIYLVYLFRFLAGIGAGGEYGIGMAIVAEAFPKEKLGKMTSIVAVAGQMGAILAAIIAAIIIPLFGWHALFLFGLLPVVMTFFIRNHLDESEEWKKSQADTENKPNVSLTELFKTPKLARQTISLMMMAIIQIAGYFGLMNWLPSIVQKNLGLSVSGSSLWMISTIVGMSLGMLLFGKILDTLGARLAYSVFLLASAASVFIFVYASNQWTMLIGGAIVGFFANGMFAGYGAIVSRLYPTSIRSTANNVIINTGRAVGGFSSVVIGFLLDQYNLLVVMGFLSILYLISFLIMLSVSGLKRENYLKIG